MLQIALLNPGHFVSLDVNEPRPGPGEVLVRVHRIGVCGTDIHAFHGRQPFFNYSRVLGHELGVEVLELGEGVDTLETGDRCSVEPYLNCGGCYACLSGKSNCCEAIRVIGVHQDGGMQPLLVLPANKLHVGNHLSLDQLALVETLAIGAHAVERANPDCHSFVLVVGAGPIGLSTMPFVYRTGARLAVMDVSEERLSFCRRQMGVKLTLNALKETAHAELIEMGGGRLPDIIIDATGNPTSMKGCFDRISHGGRIVFVGLFQGELAFDDPNFHRREVTLLASRNALPGTFTDIIQAIGKGEVDTAPWITHRMPLVEVPERFRDVTASDGLLKAMIEA